MRKEKECFEYQLGLLIITSEVFISEILDSYSFFYAFCQWIDAMAFYQKNYCFLSLLLHIGHDLYILLGLMH